MQLPSLTQLSSPPDAAPSEPVPELVRRVLGGISPAARPLSPGCSGLVDQGSANGVTVLRPVVCLHPPAPRRPHRGGGNAILLADVQANAGHFLS